MNSSCVIVSVIVLMCYIVLSFPYSEKKVKMFMYDKNSCFEKIAIIVPTI